MDSSVEKGHCLFCDAVFDSAQAIEIALDPTGVEFPNLPQPKYEGPDLRPGAGSARPVTRTKSQPAPKKAQPKAPPIVAEPVRMPDFKLDKKTRTRIILIILLIVVLVAAIAVPLIMRREEAREKLLVALPTFTPSPIEVEKDVNIGRTDNSYLLIALSRDITKDDAIRFFQAYAQKRAEIYGMDLTEAIYEPVTVKIVTPEGGWKIDRPAGRALLEDGSAVVALNP
ncbi:MAG: hypothetical protein ACOX1A_09685 [Saccharofermentanales bacterium]